MKKINVIECAKATNRSSDEYIDKLQFQLKYAKNTIVNYSKKNKELKKLVVMLKQKCLKGMNDSMEANTSNIDEDVEQSDFNYIIKEYNRSVCATMDNNK